MVANNERRFFLVPERALLSKDFRTPFAPFFEAFERKFAVKHMASFDREFNLGQGCFVRTLAFGDEHANAPTQFATAFCNVEDGNAFVRFVDDFGKMVREDD